MVQRALLTFSGTLGDFVKLWQHLVVREGDALETFYCLPYLTSPNLCYPFGAMFPKPLKPRSCQRGPNVDGH